MKIYIDESGDLGWKFDLPFRHGGSSRNLALTLLFLPDIRDNKPRKIIAGLYSKYGWVKEKKASTASALQRIEFCELAIALLHKYPDIKIDVIIANKTNVQSHIREDGNKLYNYMCGLVVPDYVEQEPIVEWIPDKRSIKVTSGNSLADYLQIKLWFDCAYKTKIIDNPRESHIDYNLQFVDWISHCVWLHFEHSVSDPFDILQSHIRIRRLFF
ncbi:MAG TPA: DUF3800 domain-containing protein [Syntrophorhabdaceae bacterium]|nr:DUF3800 domain-containing protein [Syntrophorhabdaceae bacterium]